MITSVNQFLSVSGKSMKRSAIREILKHLQKPGMISFAGGLPAPESLLPAGVTWTEPQGGLFLFVTLPSHLRLSQVICDELKCK